MKRLLSGLVLRYFRSLAKIQLKHIDPLIIGITGSAGKTSAMTSVAAVLKDTRQVKTSDKANSESGIPLNILGLYPKSFAPSDWLRLMIQAPTKLAINLVTNQEKYDTYVAELGIDSPFPPKNMAYLLTILQPDIGIFTTVNSIHGQYFEPLFHDQDKKPNRHDIVAAIASEKGKLIESLPETGCAILNADEPLIANLAKKTKAKVMTFGTKPNSTVRVVNTTWTDSGTTFSFATATETATTTFTNFLLPSHYGHTLASALCAGLFLGQSLAEASAHLEKNLLLPPGRASLIPGKHQTKIIDSSYNSSLEPLLDTLSLLEKTPGARKLALLGDIRELGENTRQEHETLAHEAAKVCDAVYLVGPAMQKYALPVFQNKKMPAFWFKNAYEAAAQLDQDLRPNDVLLVKASQNTLLLEIAVEILMAEPEKADELLCRRSDFWSQQRELLR